MKKQEITVGCNTMYATTLPVEVMFDEICDDICYHDRLMANRFQVLNIDGHILVINESIYSDKAPEFEYRCFMYTADAKDYLKMLGVDWHSDSDNTEDPLQND
jgi:hypothetical protein